MHCILAMFSQMNMYKAEKDKAKLFSLRWDNQKHCFRGKPGNILRSPLSKVGELSKIINVISLQASVGQICLWKPAACK